MDEWWTREHWMVCGGCFRPVDVTVTPPESEGGYRVGASWHYKCPACEWEDAAEFAHKNVLDREDYPPPPAPLEKLMPALRRIGLEAIAAALAGDADAASVAGMGGPDGR